MNEKVMKINELYREEAYDASLVECCAFCRGTDVWRGIELSVGNMVSGYPFEIEGIRFLNSESAYIAAAFSLGTEEHLAIQRKLVDCSNGFLAKKGIRRPNTHLMRRDWEQFNVAWMQYVVWCKCMGNSDFARKLMSIPREAVIIENSSFQCGHASTFWGTRNEELRRLTLALKRELKAQGWSKAAIKREVDARRLGEWSKVGVFLGYNVMGKILMACREALLTGVPPTIDYDCLNAAGITLLGRPLTFAALAKAG